MKRAAAFLIFIVFAAGALAGCGGDDNNSADEQSIRELVARINQATSERDPKIACSVIAPSSIKAKFNTRARCIKETSAILQSAGKQPRVEVDSISIDGDEAKVVFTGRNGETTLVREDGAWYVPIEDEAETPAEDAEGGNE